jgi:hypothetical protein
MAAAEDVYRRFIEQVVGTSVSAAGISATVLNP